MPISRLVKLRERPEQSQSWVTNFFFTSVTALLHAHFPLNSGADPGGWLGGYSPPFGSFQCEIMKGNRAIPEAILSLNVPILLLASGTKTYKRDGCLPQIFLDSLNQHSWPKANLSFLTDVYWVQLRIVVSLLSRWFGFDAQNINVMVPKPYAVPQHLQYCTFTREQKAEKKSWRD